MIIDGKKSALQIKEKLIKDVAKLAENGVKPKLVIYWIGDDPASEVYINQKLKMGKAIGAECEIRKYEDKVELPEILNDIKKDNEDSNVHGIIVQLPLPDYLDKNQLIQAINPNKDVDGLHAINQWKLMTNLPGFVPATAQGIIKLLKINDIVLEGKKVVVVGRSNLVGLPTALLSLNNNATVTICHSYTKDLPNESAQADILITAIGQPNLIKAEYVKEGAVVIDVGISRTEAGLMGDVDFNSVKDKTSAITPVPGGVGPMTVACLFENLLEACK